LLAAFLPVRVSILPLLKFSLRRCVDHLLLSVASLPLMGLLLTLRLPLRPKGLVQPALTVSPLLVVSLL
jgi:hypothetical protein